mgnify:CR=1 FL=1
MLLQIRQRKRVRVDVEAAVNRPILATGAGVLDQSVAVAGIVGKG